MRLLNYLGTKDGLTPYMTGAEAIIGRRCYMSFEKQGGGGFANPNISKILADWGEYFDNILKSVLEHATWTWAIEGCSRVFTGEMNRHCNFGGVDAIYSVH